MPGIFHSFRINAPLEKVFEAISTPNGLDSWWSKSSSGRPVIGEVYQLSFGPVYNWTAIVTKCIPDTAFELKMKESDADWTNTKVGFLLSEKNNITNAQFYHTGWKEDNEHFRISSYCWAMYLRILKRNVEFGEEVSYENRLSV